ncbi:hypothetical protein ACM64Y_01780 [Novispirillum sp. DQ9]|uniref:hypothetical protein n=1 Tax=Novispirillum sp. DQ9 TaxID=3398612 RepID=UPI003C7E292C
MTSLPDRVPTFRELCHDPRYSGAGFVAGQEAAKDVFSRLDRESPEFQQFVAGVVSVGLHILERSR